MTPMINGETVCKCYKVDSTTLVTGEQKIISEANDAFGNALVSGVLNKLTMQMTLPRSPGILFGGVPLRSELTEIVLLGYQADRDKLANLKL